MFPSRDLPAIAHDEHSVSNQSTNTNDKGKFSKALISTISILTIIAVAILIGLLSVFFPRSDDTISMTSTSETAVLILVLPMTQNSSKVISLNNNPLLANQYLNGAQRYVLRNCLQKELDSNNITKSMDILSIRNAYARYSGNTSSSTKKRQIRKRRQTTSLADQVEFNISVQCYPLISMVDCQGLIESVLDDGESLECTLADEVITVRTPSTTIKPIVAKIQNWRQVGQLFLAFGLGSLIGLERHLRSKSAGLRTHSIVGTSSALILQIGKYGFSDVLYSGMVVLDPSRIAAQIVSGISFLGAGLIITRHKAIRGLTSAASVWAAAAVAMAAGSGLWVLSLAVTGLHFAIVLGFSPLKKRVPTIAEKDSPFHSTDDGNANDNQSV